MKNAAYVNTMKNLRNRTDVRFVFKIDIKTNLFITKNI